MNASLEEVLKRDGRVLQMPFGVSMWPMLKNHKDAMLIETVSEPIKVNDVVLFKRKSGQLVLHRVIGVESDTYSIRGDNCSKAERGIEREQIIGILKGFYKGNRYIDCSKNTGYKVYVFLCRATHLIRIPIRFCFRLAKRAFRCIKRVIHRCFT